MISAFGVDHGAEVSKAGVPRPRILDQISGMFPSMGIGGRAGNAAPRGGGVTPGRTPGPPQYYRPPEPKGGVLNPKAPPASPIKLMEQSRRRINPIAIDPAKALKPAAKEAKRRGRRAGDAATMFPRGPHANSRELSALSGDTPTETLSRFGRATRRQNKEFSALIHPLSGRMEGMARGDYVAATLPPRTPRRSQQRILELASEGKSGKVRRRASADLTPGANPNLAGPKRIFVHNHPDSPGGVSHLRRSYPSSQDTAMATSMDDIGMGMNNAVVTPREAPRGGNKTQITYFRHSPEQIRLPRRMAPKGQRLIARDPDDYEDFFGGPQARRMQHDLATQGTDIADVLRGQQGMSRREIRTAQRNTVASARAATSKKKRNLAWDDFMRKTTGKPKKSIESGIYTRQQVTKSLSSIGMATARPVIRAGAKNQRKGLNRMGGSYRRLTDEQAREYARGLRQAKAGQKIREAGIKMAENSETTGLVVTAAGAGAAGAAGGAAYNHRRKKVVS